MDPADPTEPLHRALALQEAAAVECFDWPSLEGVWEKLQEEVRELQEAPDWTSRKEEVGDLLFMVVNLARHLGVDPAVALADANRKFAHRFAFILDHSDELPSRGDATRLAAMEQLWVEAKRREREARPPTHESHP